MENYSVFYTGPFRFPEKDAAGKRVLNVVKAMESVSQCDEIIVGGWEQGNKKEIKITEKITSFSFSLLDKEKGTYIFKLFGFFFMGMKALKWMFYNRHRYSLIVLYNPPFLFSLLSLMFCYCFRKKIALDSTEWYESEQLVGGKYGPAAIENWARMRLSYRLYKNIICISSYLEEYYRNSNGNIVKIPPLGTSSIRINRECKSEIDSASITFLYAGSPGKKDRLDKFIYELILAKKNGTVLPIKFYIAGITKKVFLSQYPYCKEFESILDEICVFLGRLPIEDIYGIYCKIDYCVFFRENKRYALAGFPSKYVEALSFGVPVITNNIGDIADDFPDAGFIFEPGRDRIDRLVEKLKDAPDIHSRRIMLKDIFERKYVIQANIPKIEKFLRSIR